MVVNAIVDEPTANLLYQVNFAQQAIMSASEFCTLGPKAQEAMREAYHKLEEVKDMVVMKQRVAAFNEWWNDDLMGMKGADGL